MADQYLNEDAVAVDVSNQSSVLVYSVNMDQKRMPLHKAVQERLGLLAMRLATLRCIHTSVGKHEKYLSETNNGVTSQLRTRKKDRNGR